MTEVLKQKKQTQTMVMTAAFAALIIFLTFVPGIGFIPLGFMNATTIHIPVIIGAIILGPKCGALLGGMFGLCSLINATFITVLPTSFVFSPFLSGSLKSVLICFIPRILIGVVAYYVFIGVKRLLKNKKGSFTAALAVAGIAGSLTNTLLVMNGIYFLFGSQYAEAAKKATKGLYLVILGIIGTNGVPEAIIASIFTVALGQALFALKKNLKF